MTYLLRGCLVMFGLVMFGPLLVLAITPRDVWLLALLGLAAGTWVAVVGALRLSGGILAGLLLFLAGRRSTRRRW